MAPEILKPQSLDSLAESFDSETNEFLHTSFYKVQSDDSIYFGQIFKRKLLVSPEEFTSALVRIPDKEIYPSLPPDSDIRIVEDPLPSHNYLKRPRIHAYNDYKEQAAVEILPALILEEYYGCRVQRGYITGLALECQSGDLKQYIEREEGPIDEEKFMTSLESAVSHLHSVGFAHNDINPANILLDEEKNPVLTDFNSCKPIGEKLTYCRGTLGWMDGEENEWDTSETQHDLFGIEKIREWLHEHQKSA